MSSADPMLEVESLSVTYGRGSRARTIISDLSLCIPTGSTTGLVGESGSGKSTLAKVLVGSLPPTSGNITIAGQDLHTIARGSREERRKLVQLVPQDPNSSLNPRMTVGQALAEAVNPTRPSVSRSRQRICDTLVQVSIDPNLVDRHPHQLSGGQRQRVAIARALIIEPALLIADEITSALDVSVQAEILQLLASLRETQKTTMLFISHNLAVVRNVSDQVAVMQSGDLVEQASAQQLFGRPQHPYTAQLLDSVPGSRGFSLT